jgi:hypothetical protein
MSRVRITITVTAEYDQVTEYYPPDANTPEDMLRIDLAGIEEEPYAFMDSDHANWDIKGEIIPDSKEQV